MTPNEIAVQLAEPSGRQFDVPFRDMLKDKVIYWAARHIRNTLDKDYRRRKQFLQPLIVPMHAVRNAQSGHPGNYKYYAESQQDIPLPLFANDILFDYVGSQDGATPFIWSMGLITDRFASHDKYIGELSRYSFIGNKIQVYRNPDIATVLINYIPADLRKYGEFSLACGQSICNWDDQEYNLPGDILQLVIQSIMEIDLRQPQIKAREEVQIDPQK